MGRVISRSEKIIGAALLLFLGILAVSILISQSFYDLARYGFVTGNGKEGLRPSKIVDTTAIVPENYKVMSDEETYDAVSLYEKINGKAPLYLTAGFKRLITRRYMHRRNGKLWMEIYLYDMGALKNAYSVYSRQRRIGANYDSNNIYTYRTENSEFFVRDNYYIEIIGSTRDLMQSIRQCGTNIRAALGPVGPIKEIEFLKNDRLVEGSGTYYLDNAFGIKGCKKVFSAKYKFNNDAVTVFISGPWEKSEGEKIKDIYVSFYLNEDAVKSSHSSRLKNFILLDFDGSYEALFDAGHYIAGVHESESSRDAQKLAQVLFDTLKKNGGVADE